MCYLNSLINPSWTSSTKRRSLSDIAPVRAPRPTIISQNADAVIFGRLATVVGVEAPALGVDDSADNFSAAAWPRYRRPGRPSTAAAAFL